MERKVSIGARVNGQERERERKKTLDLSSKSNKNNKLSARKFDCVQKVNAAENMIVKK